MPRHLDTPLPAARPGHPVPDRRAESCWLTFSLSLHPPHTHTLHTQAPVIPPHTSPHTDTHPPTHVSPQYMLNPQHTLTPTRAHSPPVLSYALIGDTALESPLPPAPSPSRGSPPPSPRANLSSRPCFGRGKSFWQKKTKNSPKMVLLAFLIKGEWVGRGGGGGSLPEPGSRAEPQPQAFPGAGAGGGDGGGAWVCEVCGVSGLVPGACVEGAAVPRSEVNSDLCLRFPA